MTMRLSKKLSATVIGGAMMVLAVAVVAAVVLSNTLVVPQKHISDSIVIGDLTSPGSYYGYPSYVSTEVPQINTTYVFGVPVTSPVQNATLIFEIICKNGTFTSNSIEMHYPFYSVSGQYSPDWAVMEGTWDGVDTMSFSYNRIVQTDTYTFQILFHDAGDYTITIHAIRG